MRSDRRCYSARRPVFSAGHLAFIPRPAVSPADTYQEADGNDRGGSTTVRVGVALGRWNVTGAAACCLLQANITRAVPLASAAVTTSRRLGVKLSAALTPGQIWLGNRMMYSYEYEYLPAITAAAVAANYIGDSNNTNLKLKGVRPAGLVILFSCVWITPCC